MRFIDRTEDIQRLDSLKASGLGVVWGRRRVGKTRLLLEWSKQRGGLYTVADESAEPIQRQYFAEAVATKIPGFADVLYPDWRALLRALARELGRGSFRGPIIIDEIPYLVASCPSLASTLQTFVDHDAPSMGTSIVIAGSSQRMMHGLILDANAPLYGRARVAFELKPLMPGYVQQALSDLDAIGCVRAYAAWGGIPWYWELASPFGANLDDAVDALALDPSGPLHHEPDRLLLEEQPQASALRPLLDAIGGGCHRVSEIAGRLNLPATSLSRPLSRLLDLGLVTREQPFGDNERSGKRALYKIADPFLRLWFRVVAPRRAVLVASPSHSRRAIWKQFETALFSETWEDVCRRAVPFLDIPAGPFGPAYRFWHGNGPEWDIVASSLDGKTLLLGEVKWTEKADDKFLNGVYSQLVRKGIPNVPRAEACAIVHAVFTPLVTANSKVNRPFLVFDANAVLAPLGFVAADGRGRKRR